MQVQYVNRVLGVFVDLKPVARRCDRERLGRCIGHALNVIDRERWFLFWWAQIGENETVVLVGGIRALHDAFANGAVDRFRAGANHCAIHIEVPAVIAADDALLGDDAVFQRGPAMRAMSMQEAGAATAIPKQHQGFAQQPHQDGQVCNFRTHGDRLPVTAHVLAARRPRPDVGQFRVFRGRAHLMIALKTVRSGFTTTRL